MKIFRPGFFEPLLSVTPGAFSSRAIFHAATQPFRPWDGMFKIPIPEHLRQFIPGMKPTPKAENTRREEGEKRNGRRMKIQVEVLAYPLKPGASNIPLRGDLKNLCPNGVCVEFLRDVDEDHLFLLSFKLAEEKSVRRPGRVVWTRNRVSGFQLLNAYDAREVLKETQYA